MGRKELARNKMKLQCFACISSINRCRCKFVPVYALEAYGRMA